MELGITLTMAFDRVSTLTRTRGDFLTIWELRIISSRILLLFGIPASLKDSKEMATLEN